MGLRKASGWLAAAVAVTLSGCGGGSQYANNPRPPALINVTAAIAKDRVLLSPDHFGAGEVTLIIANQTGASQQLTLASAQAGQLQDQTAPINPGDTAKLQATLASGQYSVKVDDPTIAPATIVVGKPRASGQSQLLQP